MRSSFGSMVTSTSSASGSTSTPAALVWIRPCDSVTGTRCTRCTPPSHLSRDQTPLPPSGTPLLLIASDTSLTPPRSESWASITSVTQPCRSAYLVYIRSRSPANSADSSPPSPALISTITSLASCGSRGMSSSASRSSSAGREAGDGLRLGGERRVLGGQLARGGQVGAGLLQLAGRLVQRDQFGVPAADPPGGALVGVDGRVGQPPLQLGVLVEEGGQALTAHAADAPWG